MALELKDVISPIVAGVVAGAIAWLGPRLQHRYWTRQKLFDLRIATIDQANIVLARLSDLKSREGSSLLDHPELPVNMGELVTKVQVLFGDDIAAHYNSTTSSLISIRNPDAYFIFEAKKLRDQTLFRMYKTALEGGSFPSEISPGFPTLPDNGAPNQPRS